MALRKFSIGIDLGTSNSVLAYAPLSGEGGTQVLAIPQWDTPSTVTESETLPSCLYLPEEAVAAQIRGKGPDAGDWVVGRLAERKASETPGRVVKSAKSWLCHHAADRSAPFLPWGSDALASQDKISPVAASAKILAHLRGAWNARFAGTAPDFAFDAQDITITVPASFDAAAQRLTLAAADEAGFPDHVRLLEEPQAAFYCWLERQQRSVERAAGLRMTQRAMCWSSTSAAALRTSACSSSPRPRTAAIPPSSASPSATTSCSAATISTSRSRICSSRGSRRAAGGFRPGNGTIWSPAAAR